MSPAPVLRLRAWALLAALVLVALPWMLEQALQAPPQWRVTQAGHADTVDDERMQALELPHQWRGSCEPCRSIWYRFDVRLAEAPRESLAVYLPLLADNAAIYLNGRLLGQGGRMADPVARLGVLPLWVAAPAALWQPGDNRLYVLLKAEHPWAGLMPAPAVGPEAALQGAWRGRSALAVTAPQVLATAAVALALMLAVLAWYRRRDSGYRQLALAALLFGADGLARLVVEPPVAAAAWDTLLLLIRGALVASLWALLPALGTGAAPAATGWRRPLLLGAGALLAAAAAHEPTGAALAAAEGTLRMALAAAGLRLALRGWRQGAPLALACGAALVLAALADAWRLAPISLPAWLGSEPLPLLHWALVALLGAAAWRQLAGFVQTLNTVEGLNLDLEALVQERTQALQAQFERVRELERREAIAAERERLMRDMHDGVGGHLVAMLAMIENDRRRPGELADVARAALDDMRLMIDSLEPLDDDLNAVLAIFHDRLAPRLRSSGVTLHWAVDLLPALPGLTPARVLHLLRILQEAVTNAMRHGRAQTLWIDAAAAADGGVAIGVRDDGQGFEPGSGRSGRGLKNMQRRADEAGLLFKIRSRPGEGTTVTLQIPAPA